MFHWYSTEHWSVIKIKIYRSKLLTFWQTISDELAKGISRKILFYDRTGFSLSESCLLDFLADSLHGCKESGTKSIWNRDKIAAPTEIDDVREREGKNLAQHTSLRSFAIVKSVERENVINPLDTKSPRLFRSRPGVAFFQLRNFDSADANYAISYALNIYDSQHSIMITRENIKAGKAEPSHILLAPINLLKTSDKKVGK